MKNDNINHPSHYCLGKYEVIDLIEKLEPNYHLGCAIKYIARAGKKDPKKKIEDLQKAIWYIKRFNEKKSLSGLFRTSDNPEYMMNDWELDEDLEMVILHIIDAIQMWDKPSLLDGIELLEEYIEENINDRKNNQKDEK